MRPHAVVECAFRAPIMYAHSRTHASNFSNQMLYTCRLQLRKAALDGTTCLTMEENSPQYLNVTFNCRLNLAYLNTPRLACINFSIFLTLLKINTLLEFINCKYTF